MLHEIEILELRRIAELAGALREARDRLLKSIAEDRLGEPKPARGPSDPASAVGLDSLSGNRAASELQDAVTGLPQDVLRCLWVVMKTGRGDYARKDWDRAIAEAAAFPESRLATELLDAVDLHDELMKGLHALGSDAEPQGSEGP